MIEAFVVSSMQQCVNLCRQEDRYREKLADPFVRLLVSIYDRFAICRSPLMHYTFLMHYISSRIHLSVSGPCITSYDSVKHQTWLDYVAKEMGMSRQDAMEIYETIDPAILENKIVPLFPPQWATKSPLLHPRHVFVSRLLDHHPPNSLRYLRLIWP